MPYNKFNDQNKDNPMKKSWILGLLVIFGLLFSVRLSFTEEGMYPISDILKLDLKSKGLKIDLQEIYNPGGVSLIDGIVKVGGCTGSTY